MIAFLRTRRCRLPLAVLLLLVTQLAFAGQSCRAVMLGMNGAGETAATHQSGAASGAPQSLEAEAPPCCGDDAPPVNVCLVAVDVTTAAALVASSTSLPDLAPPVAVSASSDAFDRAHTATSLPADSAGPPLPVYIVYHRFLS